MNIEPLATQKQFGYVGGTFSDAEIAEARENNIPLTMDCAVPGPCLNDCTYCGFLYVNKSDKLKQTEILKIFEEFALIGGKSIKILGEGEPLLREDMPFLLQVIRDLGMTPVLFTCGDVLGSDQLAKKIHNKTSMELLEELNESGTTVMLKFEAKQQDHITGRSGYSRLRDRALDYLLEYGFNRSSPTRLGFSIVLLRENIDEIPQLFNDALSRNIYPLVCPLMPIGKMEVDDKRRNDSPFPGEIECLSKKLVSYRESKGIFVCKESAFPGGAPCDISRAGMYVDDAGNVKVCEADETVGNIRDDNIPTLWQKCSECKTAKYRNARWLGLCFPKISAGIVNRNCEINSNKERLE